LKGLLESRNYEKTINYSNDVIKDASGFSIGMDIRMKVFRDETIKTWYENTIEQTLNTKKSDPDTDIIENNYGEIFDNKTTLKEASFFCDDHL
jgi:hypothetical protein